MNSETSECLGSGRPVPQPCVGQLRWTVGHNGSASVTHIDDRQISALPNNINFINASNKSGDTFEARARARDNKCCAGLGVSTLSYYYLYGSVTRCDACDACDKDMACQQRAMGSTPLTYSTVGSGCATACSIGCATGAQRNQSSGEQPEEQNQSSVVSCSANTANSVESIAHHVWAQALAAANQEIRRLAQIAIEDIDDNFNELLPCDHAFNPQCIDQCIDKCLDPHLKDHHLIHRQSTDIPLEDIPLEEDITLVNIPLEDLTLEDIPLEDIPLEDIPLEDIPLDEDIASDSDFDDRQILDICDIIDATSEEDAEQVEECPEERSVSNLEKYYTQSLEEQLSDEDRRPSLPAYTHFASMSPFSDNEEWVDETHQLLDDQQQVQCSSDIENGHMSDGSTSSEEGLFSTPNYMARVVYGNPLAYSLHTIVEESCEESDRNSSRPSSSAEEAPTADGEKLFTFAVSHNQCSDSQKRDSWCPSEVDSEADSEQAMSCEFLDQEEYESPSRLEKYFMSGLLGSGAFDYPDDCEFADESDCDSSKPSLEVMANGQTCAELTQSADFDQSNCDTLKRNTIEVAKTMEVPQEVTQVSDEKTAQDSTSEEVSPEEEEDLEVSTPALRCSSPEDSPTEVTSQPTEEQSGSDATNSSKLQEEEVQTFMNKLLSRMSGINRMAVPAGAEDMPVSNRPEPVSESAVSVVAGNDNPLPSLKSLEHQIARLMEAVSPARLSVGSDSNSSYTSSSTIGSNNSDYGSDTLESDEEEAKHFPTGEKRKSNGRQTRSAANQSANSADSTVSEETVYICKQLMGSLKKLTEIAFNEKSGDVPAVTAVNPSSDMAKARMYIRDQIVALMHTVKSVSPASTSPAIRDRKTTQTPFNHQSVIESGGESSDCGDGSPKMGGSAGKKKASSESGSETTCSASVSIPSYEDSDNTPTDSEISHEMEELFALLDTTAKESMALNETNLTARPASDEDRASLKSWEARISMLGKREEQVGTDRKPSPELLSRSPVTVSRTQTPSKVSEITINGKEVETKTPVIAAAAPVLIPIGHKTVVKIDDNSATATGRTESLSPIFESLKDRSFSSDSVSSVQTVKARLQASQSEISSDGTQSTSRLAIDEVDDESDANLTSGSLRKSFNAKEKASSEDNLLAANMMAGSAPTKAKPIGCAAKSAGNISELDTACNNQSGFRDTGYYSFKSSEESVKSLEESSGTSIRSHSTSTLPHMKRMKSETIVEVDEESSASETTQTMPDNKRLFTPSHSSAAKVLSFSSPNIVNDVFNGSRSGSLPPESRVPVPNLPHRSRSSFFSTSGVLRKLTALRGGIYLSTNYANLDFNFNCGLIFHFWTNPLKRRTLRISSIMTSALFCSLFP